MIVVSNTYPLTNLAAIGQFDLLNKLYTRIHIATGVWDELNAFGQLSQRFDNGLLSPRPSRFKNQTACWLTGQ